VLKKIFRNGYAGLRNWLLQRLTALVMALYSLTMAVLVAMQRPDDYPSWRAMFSPPWIRVATLMFCLCLLLHAWLGVRDILKDYVTSLMIRMSLQRLFAAAIVVYGFWAATILWSI
jgi:succinate dehydrogenase / fumarate reductase, membrane anchor subunit